MQKTHDFNLLDYPPGANLSKDDRISIEQMQLKLRQDEELKKAIASNSTHETLKFKFDKAIDDLLLDFIGSKLDLYIKLMDPKINMFFKSLWYKKYRSQLA